MTVDEFLAEWRNGDAFVTAHTSGSTGTPKAIRLLKADMLASARATNARFGIGAHSRLLLCLSPDYIAGKMMIVRA
ncbi:MAG: AMP-dependent synthetase, partial [Bacteroidales bacterium]|nr:AMP-dependent synthetase [Bacteroidales bacterium]